MSSSILSLISNCAIFYVTVVAEIDIVNRVNSITSVKAIIVKAHGCRPDSGFAPHAEL